MQAIWGASFLNDFAAVMLKSLAENGNLTAYLVLRMISGLGKHF